LHGDFDQSSRGRRQAFEYLPKIVRHAAEVVMRADDVTPIDWELAGGVAAREFVNHIKFQIDQRFSGQVRC
jgi:hypothetical protein